MTGSSDGTVRVWNLQLPDSARTLGALPPGRSLARDLSEWRSGRTPAEAIELTPTAFAFTSDVHRAVIGTADGTVWMVDPQTLQPVGAPMVGHTDNVKALAVSPDGGRIASAGFDGTVRLWDARTHLPVGEPLPPTDDDVDRSDDSWRFQQNSRYKLKFSRDSRRLLSDSEQVLQVWDAEAGRPLGHPLQGCPTKAEREPAISPDGHRVAAGCDDNTVHLWDADTGDPEGNPMPGHEYPPGDVAFTPDGERIVSVSLDSVRFWEAGTQRAISEHGREGISSYDTFDGIAISDDGRDIVTGGSASMYRWDGKTGDPIGSPMRGLQDQRNAVIAFTHDGRYIVSTEIASLRFWDTATGNPVGGPLDSLNTRAIGDVVVGPDDHMIYTSGLEGEFLWPGPASWHDALCDKLTTNMSHKQWRDWVSPEIEYIKVCPDLPIAPD